MCVIIGETVCSSVCVCVCVCVYVCVLVVVVVVWSCDEYRTFAVHCTSRRLWQSTCSLTDITVLLSSPALLPLAAALTDTTLVLCSLLVKLDKLTAVCETRLSQPNCVWRCVQLCSSAPAVVDCSDNSCYWHLCKLQLTTCLKKWITFIFTITSAKLNQF